MFYLLYRQGAFRLSQSASACSGKKTERLNELPACAAGSGIMNILKKENDDGLF